MGIQFGVVVVFVVAYWTSYNIWHLVVLKRELCKERRQNLRAELASNNGINDNTTPSENNTIDTNVTYADLSGWLYGAKLQKWTTISICVQQLAVCTVFLSFIGENLSAAMEEQFGHIPHTTVITMVVPGAMMLSCLPNLKMLAPVMALATVTLFAGFGVLGYLIQQAWTARHHDDHHHHDYDHNSTSYDSATTSMTMFAGTNSTNNNDDDYVPPKFKLSELPLSVCAVLYSFEGICLILPIEASMQEEETSPSVVRSTKRKHFGLVFVIAMTASAIIYALIAGLCVMAFGSVTSGSVTAFLVEKADMEMEEKQHFSEFELMDAGGGDEQDGNNNDDDDLSNRLQLLYIANTLVSIAVLLTYPLQLFPSYELVGPWWNKVVMQKIPMSVTNLFSFYRRRNHSAIPNHDDDDEDRNGDNSDSNGEYDAVSNNHNSGEEDADFQLYQRNLSLPPIRGACTKPSLDNVGVANALAHDETTAVSAESAQNTNYMSTPSSTSITEDSTSNNTEVEATITTNSWEFIAVGDSPFLRAALVLLTYVLAIAVPNVQLLVSLAGALSGSATGLIIPPLLQWAFLNKQQMMQQNGESLTATSQQEAFHDDDDASTTNANNKNSILLKRIELIVLFTLGNIVMVIGTGAALADIFKVYMSM